MKSASVRQHCFESIPGWFGHQSAVRTALPHLPETATVVEVGAFCGRCTAFLAVELLNSNRTFQLHVVDTWQDSQDTFQQTMRQQYGVSDGSLRGVFDTQMARAGLTSFIRPLQMESVSAAKTFQDESIDLVIVDAGHSYHDVCSDIRAWWPKLTWGGQMLFDDYDQAPWVEVPLAVHDFIPQAELRVIGPAALYRKQIPVRGQWQSTFEPPGEWMGFIPYVTRPDQLAQAAQSVKLYRQHFCIVDQSDNGFSEKLCSDFATFHWAGSNPQEADPCLMA